MHAEDIAFTKFDPTAPGATDTYNHVPDPTAAADPENPDDEQLLCVHSNVMHF